MSNERMTNDKKKAMKVVFFPLLGGDREGGMTQSEWSQGKDLS